MSFRSLSIGCLSIVGIAVGCIALFVVAAWFQSGRLIDVDRHAPPVATSGECPTDEVEVWFDEEQMALMEDTMGPLAPESNDMNALDAIDVGQVRARIAERADVAVPACVAGTRDEMLAMATDVANSVAYVQDRELGPDAFRGLVGMMALSRTMRFRMSRVREAEDALAARLGVDLGDDTASDEGAYPSER